ncbi:MAG: hypothetical protein SGPRY_013783, partial [Prymnesium sp.]
FYGEASGPVARPGLSDGYFPFLRRFARPTERLRLAEVGCDRGLGFALPYPLGRYACVAWLEPAGADDGAASPERSDPLQPKQPLHAAHGRAAIVMRVPARADSKESPSTPGGVGALGGGWGLGGGEDSLRTPGTPPRGEGRPMRVRLIVLRETEGEEGRMAGLEEEAGGEVRWGRGEAVEAMEAARVSVEELLHSRWDEYRCYRVWHQLWDGAKPPVDELKVRPTPPLNRL